MVTYREHSIVFFHRTQRIETCQFPLPTLAKEDGCRPYAAVDRHCICVDEPQRFLVPFCQTLAPLRSTTGALTATLCRPHLIVSSVRLFLLICQLSGVRRSVAMYMYESVYARSVILQAAPDGSIHFYCVQDFHDAGVSQGPELAERIASKRQPRPGCADVKGEDAALGAIFLAYAGQPVGASGRCKRAEGQKGRRAVRALCRCEASRWSRQCPRGRQNCIRTRALWRWPTQQPT
jgi:hypothetical protein